MANYVDEIARFEQKIKNARPGSSEALTHAKELEKWQRVGITEMLWVHGPDVIYFALKSADL